MQFSSTHKMETGREVEMFKFLIDKIQLFRLSWKADRHQETIECPNCGAIETATVEHGVPFNTYIHHCSECQYIIMESEWEPVSLLARGEA
jgi:hypothetical protein